MYDSSLPAPLSPYWARAEGARGAGRSGEACGGAQAGRGGVGVAGIVRSAHGRVRRGQAMNRLPMLPARVPPLRLACRDRKTRAALLRRSMTSRWATMLVLCFASCSTGTLLCYIYVALKVR